uniref:protein HEG-like n=1 Tax=Styela clava TaxID=7725 RepID=UPI001939C660|nr:protein HEG-like [Styela clava]
MDPVTVSSITSTSFQASFTEVSDAVKYYVTLTPQHASAVRVFCLDSSDSTISGLSSDTEYRVTIKSETSDGTIGTDSEAVPLRTNPGAPTIQTGEEFPDSVFVFFQLNNYARVSEWTIQYREFGSSDINTVRTNSDKYYSHWLSGLTGDTTYEIRARASKLSDGITLAESEVSEWQNFTTASHLVFGRVVLSDVTYVAAHPTVDSAEWNTTLQRITNEYTSIDNNGISLLEIKNDGGNPLAFYQIKVKDKTLPSTTNYTISGTGFRDSFVNNGDKAFGTVFMKREANSYRLIYDPGDENPCDIKNALVENHLLMTPEHSSKLDINLGTSSFSEGNTFIEASLVIAANGDLLNSLGNVIGSVPMNTIFGIAPKVIVKDCLKNQSVPLYTQYLDAVDTGLDRTPVNPFFYTTTTNLTSLRSDEVTYTSSTDGTSIAIFVPALSKAVKYEIVVNADGVAEAIYEESALDATTIWKIDVKGLTDGNTYLWLHRVTFRQQNDTDVVQVGDLYNYVANKNQCSTCSGNASCTSRATTSDPPICVCNEGYTGDGTFCEVVKYCDSNPCSTNATCEESTSICDSDEPYNCTCHTGYSGNGTTCTDDNECEGTNDCHSNATCTNTDGSYRCTCNQGYTGNGTTCTDIDECSSGSHDCHNNASCSNTNGSHTCTCNQGYTGNGTTCTDIDECSSGSHGCHNNASCSNTYGSHTCTCNQGYTGNGTTCTDIDECSSGSHDCHKNASCSNTDGSHTCTCNQGYTGNGTTCTDIDECSSGSHVCHNNASCSNTDGSHTCTCNQGYTGNGTTCTDIDECSSGSHDCHNNASCSNTNGSHTYIQIFDTLEKITLISSSLLLDM